MELKEFQGLALRTESQIQGIKLNRENLITLLKVVVEVSEILDGVKKALFYNKTAKLEGDFTSRLHTLIKLIEALKWQNDGRGPLGTVMDANETISNVDPRVFHGILGIVTESGELAAALLKAVEDPTYDIDAVNLQEEMSDIAWYEAIIHDYYNLDWGQGLENVINKLRLRYPDKYSDECADNRDLDAERAALEVGVEIADGGRKAFEKSVEAGLASNRAQAFITGKHDPAFDVPDLTAPTGMTYVAGEGFVEKDDDRRIFYVNIPDDTSPEQLEAIMDELKNRYLHTQTYEAKDE